MTEQLTNGGFTSNLGSWTNTAGNVWVYDATGAAHTGGAAKATHDGVENSTWRFRMYQNISISNTDKIDTAEMDAWIQWNDSVAAQSDEVENCTATFWVQLKDPGGNFYGVGKRIQNFGTLGSVNLLSSTDVKATLQAGGDGTWGVYLICDIYRANIRPVELGWLVTWFDDLSLDVTWEAYGSTTETFTVTDATSVAATLGGSTSDTVTMSDDISAGVPAATDFRYYLGSYDGKVYF